MGTESELGAIGVGRRSVDPAETARAQRRWWDADAQNYHSEHGSFLGSRDFVWCPEGLREQDAHLLGPREMLRGKRVLEVGSGSAMCSRWVAAAGANSVAIDISEAMLRYYIDVDPAVPLIQADAAWLPFQTNSFDLAFTAYGAIPFVSDSAAVMAEVARVLRPGGRWVFATTHPVRWSFPDSPGPDGLVAQLSYFDRTAYVEFDGEGEATYVEHHRTLGDRVRELVAAGFVLRDLIEPEWPDGLDQIWGGWSPLRGRVIPGTSIFVCDLAS